MSDSLPSFKGRGNFSEVSFDVCLLSSPLFLAFTALVMARRTTRIHLAIYLIVAALTRATGAHMEVSLSLLSSISFES